MSQRRSFLAIPVQRIAVISLILSVGFAVFAPSAFAHHALGGNTPSNTWQGFLSGLAHPLIGLDHFAFIVAIGLVAVGQVRGMLIPAGFVVAALLGTGIHLLSVDLPLVEVAIALSVILIGFLLIKPLPFNGITLTALGAVAGLFHGYAYGESIIGAGMTPLIAYLLGFSVIQYCVSLASFFLGTHFQQSLKFQYFGFAIATIGVIFLANGLIS